jgi:putative endonuclease
MKFLVRFNIRSLVSRLATRFRERSESLPVSGPPTANRWKGDSAELAAYHFLRRNGYRIVARKYRRRSGEIDLIGWDGDILAFIEVKFRTCLEHGRPEEAVNWRKQKQISRVAKEYRTIHKLYDINYRFDIVSIQGSPENRAVQIMKDAFKEPL